TTGATVDNLIGSEICIQARFYFADGTPVRDFDGHYCSPEGLVLGENKFVPKFPRTDVTDWQVWVPYSQLHLSGGNFTLCARMTIRRGGRTLASRTGEYFSIRTAGVASSGGGWQSASIKNVRVTHNFRAGNEWGMLVYADLGIRGFQNIPCKVVAWFFTADGRPLPDYDGSYTSTEGQVSSSTSVVPLYKDSNFTAVAVFIPYNQLHRGRGLHRLGVNLGVFQGPESLAYKSELTYFTVTLN
ncbi:MAG: hypothetical protein GY765_43925, partial [bacterium]|nr:hypothetical protein [bacterium]